MDCAIGVHVTRNGGYKWVSLPCDERVERHVRMQNMWNVTLQVSIVYSVFGIVPEGRDFNLSAKITP